MAGPDPAIMYAFGRQPALHSSWPDLIRPSWRYQDVAVPDAGEDLHSRGRQYPPLHRRIDHRAIRLAQPDIIKAKACEYVLRRNHEARSRAGIDPHADPIA